MKGEEFLGRFAPTVKEKFRFKEISECVWSYKEGKSRIDIHEGCYENDRCINILLYIKNKEIVGLVATDGIVPYLELWVGEG